MGKVTRRGFLKATGALSALAAGGASLHALAATHAPASTAYAGWRQLLRDRCDSDKRTRGAHLVNCTGACPQLIHVRDGVVVRSEQSGDLAGFPGLPDPNPRGCAKGACGVDYLYGSQRVKYPLIRTGERGEGKWRRASWDEALELIADKMVETAHRHGPDSSSVFCPGPAVAPVAYAAGHRFAHLMGAHAHTFFDWYGDHPPGQTQTLGVQCDTAETADWFNARLLIFWGANPVETRIPDAHFMTEAALNGTRVVTITPDYNGSASKSSLWLHPTPGTDTALALGLAHVIVKEGLFDQGLVAEQTDLPLLVRSDTHAFLREADLVEGGGAGRFYCWDRRKDGPAVMKGSWDDPAPPAEGSPFLGRDTRGFPDGTLALGDLDPALEGRFQVVLKSGRGVEVRPVFDLYKAVLLKDYTPEKASRLCGVPAKTIATLARDYARARPAMIISGAGVNHWYHGDILLRVLHLLAALTGNVGTPGGGVNHYTGQWKSVLLPGLNALAFPTGTERQRFCQTTIWTYVHAEAQGGLAKNEALRHSLATGQMPLYPKDGRSPKVFIVYRGNFLNQAKAQRQVLRTLWPKLELVVDINIRMDTTALYSDVVLPAAHWYEKTDLNMTEEHSFLATTEPAIQPLWEAKSEWEIFRRLSAKVAEVARRKGRERLFDAEFQWERDLGRLEDAFTDHGRLATGEDAAQFLLDRADGDAIKLDRLHALAPRRLVSDFTSPGRADAPYVPFQYFAKLGKPWPTLTGRQQFYLDHPVFLEAGLELPVYRAPLDADAYPLRFNTPHGRLSVHSTWRDNPQMLRLGRGGPVAVISPDEAAKRGLADDDWAEIRNDHGRIVCRVKIRAGEPMGRVTMAHAPELYMDLIEGGSQSVCPVRINPTQLVGDYGHLVFRPNYYGPSGTHRDVRVEVKRYVGPVPG
ncbi:MAG: molybdopterin-dependent oxidoreductase [Alphaproteobacteria bacterium]|nr:molybdopterin-dependent oxidoreductase [Alphaproteobacteria bacterium]